ncbi:helix-turn-helix domain-containing protein [Pseudomonas frederiksbergensis]|uniref:helix-turn-helix domain-containing protein n=1 Tax=Pseudomonas frederiksbergensis TaxID=104087 RepID=UPI002E821DF8|nr:helix-turn-helix transcriptional regulator [Pseudomonas frederiksbergensis]
MWVYPEVEAERLGVGNEAVSPIERGIVMPGIERLVELASIFGSCWQRLARVLRVSRGVSTICFAPWKRRTESC